MQDVVLEDYFFPQTELATANRDASDDALFKCNLELLVDSLGKIALKGTASISMYLLLWLQI